MSAAKKIWTVRIYSFKKGTPLLKELDVQDAVELYPELAEVAIRFKKPRCKNHPPFFFNYNAPPAFLGYFVRRTDTELICLYRIEDYILP